MTTTTTTDTTSRTRRSTVVGVFSDLDRARSAIDALKAHGFRADAISVLAPDRQRGQELAEQTGTEAGSGAATGAIAGGILGGLGGWLIGIGALAIPGVGPFIAAGAFATALGGAAIGAGVGAIAGALIGMGVPKEEAEYYEGEVKSGRTLVTVNAPDRYAEAQQLLREHGAYDIESRHSASAVGTPPVKGQQNLELREEELQARKETVETGRVTLGKEIVEEEKSVDVPLKREDVYVERRPVDRPSDHPVGADSERTVDVPVHEERVDVQKQPIVYEEVSAGKQAVVRQQPVSETVRREELRVETEGDPRVSAADGITAEHAADTRPTP